MFSYSMVQMVRSHGPKLDRPLRNELLHLYKPFKWTPCFLHQIFEKGLKKWKKISVVIQFDEQNFSEGCHEVEDTIQQYMRCRSRKHFSIVSCMTVDVTPEAIESLLLNCQHIKKIYLNREVQTLLNHAVPSANADQVVRKGSTLTGQGVTIAVIDTGVYPHDDLVGRITKFVDFINEREDPYDDNGHGTHCAGAVAGSGLLSEGKYVAPAPEANIIGVKVLDKIGSGSLETVMSGVEWCIQYNENNENKIHVLSMSLGSRAEQYDEENEDPMVQIVNKAWEQGMVVCAAAGNDGPDAQTIASPGISRKIITVGALDDSDTSETKGDDDVANFSSRGPTIYGVTKPDILAPGVNIISLRSPGSYIDKLQKGNRVEDDYFQMSGTSMATPICAGIVALALQNDPSLTPDEVKQLLKDGASPWRNRDPNVYGAGFINGENFIPS
ncbi:S8 family peptidase [Salirhabdus salicampi]|uniref:S8 family peptidase n=1 Tax=Salirhabdus salicampi TaxID=476102 RepID=UPI0020C38859|nr:S8 family peptidase [Salirhabdus salicampi]MCP8617314.1 S8 family peptidase [Salirhabdus salicampi]